MIEAELGLPPVGDGQAREVTLAELKEGQILASHVLTAKGRMVLMPGIRLSAGHIQLLQNLAELLELEEPIRIRDTRLS
jgi:hypothetical protein